MSSDITELNGGGSEGNGAGNILLMDIEQEMRRSYLGYAVSTLISRALPDVRDGFNGWSVATGLFPLRSGHPSYRHPQHFHSNSRYFGLLSMKFFFV